MGIRSKALHLVSDITTVLLNPISDKPSKPSAPSSSSSSQGDESDSEPKLRPYAEEESSAKSVNGEPDTSSFSAFLTSLLSSESKAEKSDHEPDFKPEVLARKGLISRGKQSVGKAFSYAARLGGFGRNGGRSCEVKESDNHECDGGHGEKCEGKEDEALVAVRLPEMSDSSALLSEKTMTFVYVSLPALAKGKKWVLLYSTWKHGISLSTLYRRSMLCTGLSLLVVGDKKGAVFGGLVEAPLTPSTSRKYQGSNNTFLFTDMPGRPLVYRPTGANRYFTLCSPDFLALGGGNRFALYLDNELLNGSSAASDTYGNPCLSHSNDFAVKEVELWGFVYATKYEETLALLCQDEPHGVCRW